jgi:hypothetical protein
MEAAGAVVLDTFLSLGIAIIAMAIGFAATALISYKFSLGFVTLPLLVLIPAIAGICAFVIAFKRLRVYMSH